MTSAVPGAGVCGEVPSNKALKLTSLTWHDGFGLQLNAGCSTDNHRDEQDSRDSS